MIVTEYDKNAEMIAVKENPMKIPNVPPTELMSPKRSNSKYSS